MSDTQAKFNLLEYLEANAPVIMDGPASSVFQSENPAEALSPSLANMHQQDLVRALYRKWQESGAQVVRTNTAHANEPVLQTCGTADRMEALNNMGMSLLRETLSFEVVACGWIEALPANFRQQVPLEGRRQAYGTQSVYLSDTGAQFLALAGFSEDDELQIALQGVANASVKDIWVFWQAGVQDTLEAIEAHLKSALEHGADYLGVILPSDHPRMVELVQTLVENFGVLGVLLEMAPQHQILNQQSTPELQQRLRGILQTQVAMLGGGRSAGFGHVQLMRRTLDELLLE